MLPIKLFYMKSPSFTIFRKVKNQLHWNSLSPKIVEVHIPLHLHYLRNPEVSLFNTWRFAETGSEPFKYWEKLFEELSTLEIRGGNLFQPNQNATCKKALKCIFQWNMASSILSLIYCKFVNNVLDILIYK